MEVPKSWDRLGPPAVHWSWTTCCLVGSITEKKNKNYITLGSEKLCRRISRLCTAVMRYDSIVAYK